MSNYSQTGGGIIDTVYNGVMKTLEVIGFDTAPARATSLQPVSPFVPRSRDVIEEPEAYKGMPKTTRPTNEELGFTTTAANTLNASEKSPEITFGDSESSRTDTIGFRREPETPVAGNSTGNGVGSTSFQIGGHVGFPQRDPADEQYWKAQYVAIKQAYLQKKAQMAQTGGRRH